MRSLGDMVDRVLPRFWKASLLGTKNVRSWDSSRKSAIFATWVAPPAAVTLKVGAVFIKLCGGSRNVSMICRRPPVQDDGTESVARGERSGVIRRVHLSDCHPGMR